jgi:uncharacterized protein (UPF0332 family)
MESSVKQLSKYRFECCQEALEDANIMFEAGRYKNTLNRSYYAIFHAIRSINALQGFDSGKHSGVIAYFNQNYVKTGIFPKEVSKIIKVASEKRERADYLDFYVASKEETQLQMERATEFKVLVEEYLKECKVI